MASPFSRSAAKTGRLPAATAARRPSATPKASGFHADNDGVCPEASDAGLMMEPLPALEGALFSKGEVLGPTKHQVAWASRQAAMVVHTARIIFQIHTGTEKNFGLLLLLKKWLQS
mmetsp:Transcript_70519/g.136093  ORF Transcript_70519/g.136093 Transcript_70519/m.136093 type:complete len:116 (-) Transcript_70519:1-348(-)